VSPQDVKPGPQGRLGIQKWKSKLVGRGVLIDMLKWRAKHKRPVQATTTNECFTVAEFEAALKAQKTKVRPGDFLLVRTGWMTQYKALSPENKRSMGNLQVMRSCGVDPHVEMISWLWDHHVAAIGCDNPMVEPYPPRADRGHLHPHALSYLGLPLGEQWDMDELADDCARDKRYEFMFVSVPLHLVGGVASPPNAVAIK